MLQAMNDSMKGWLGMVIVGLIALPFALWGVQSYFDDAGPRFAAEVNSSEISANEFERTVSMQRQTLLRQNDGKMPIDENTLRNRTLTQMINQRLLEYVTFESGFRISDAIVKQRIKQIFTIDGVFDRERFEMSIGSIGMSVPMYEQSLRNELRVQQMQSAISSSAFVTEKAANKLAALSEQTRDISVLTFNVDHFSTSTQASAEEIKQFYETNIQRFMRPEKIKVDFVELTSAALAENIKIDEHEIVQMYDEYVARASAREERKASHILILASEDNAASQEKIESLQKELMQGADFAELAKQHSQDPGSAALGGSLDWVAVGDMVKPFETALYELQQGTVSDVVETQFGFHLIKLDDIRSEAIVPMGVKRYEFEEEIKMDRVASMFFDIGERLANAAFENPDSLDVVAEELELVIKTSDYFSRFEGEGVASNEKLRNVAFSALVLEQGNNSDIIELDTGHVVVVRLNEHVPATAIPLQQVSSRIENILKIQSGHKQTMAAALDAKGKLEAGASLDSLTADGITIETIVALGRRDSARAGDASILHNSFEMVAAEEGKVAVKAVDLASGDVALVVLNNVNMLDNVLPGRVNLVRSEAVRESALRDFSSALQVIRENADISKNMRLVNNTN